MGEAQADSGHLEDSGHSNQLGVPWERYCADELTRDQPRKGPETCLLHNPVKGDLENLGEIALEAKQSTGYLSKILTPSAVPVLRQFVNDLGADVICNLAFKRR